MRLRRYACVREVKDPERQVKSIAGLRSLYKDPERQVKSIAGLRSLYKDPERQVKSIAGLRSLYAEGTTPNLSFLSTNIDKGIVGRDQSAASGRESSDSPISSSNF